MVIPIGTLLQQIAWFNQTIDQATKEITVIDDE